MSFDRLCATPIDRHELSGGRAKTSSVHAPAALHVLPDAEFGMVVRHGVQRRRALPMHNAEACQDSAQHLINLRESLPEEVVKASAARIRRRWRVFGGSDAGLPEVVVRMAKQSSPEPLEWDDAYVWPHKEEPTDIAPVIHEWALEGVRHPQTGAPVAMKVSCAADAERAETYLVSRLNKLSQKDRRAMARNILESYRKMGFDTGCGEFVSKRSEAFLRYAGERVRPDADLIIAKERLDALESQDYGVLLTDAQKTSGSVHNVYRDLVQAFKKESMDEELIAERLSTLDEALGLNGVTPAYELVFLRYDHNPQDDGRTKSSAENVDTGSNEDDETWTFGQTLIRGYHLKQLPAVNLSTLENYLGRERVDSLRDDPVGTFRDLTKIQQKIVARFTEEMIISGNRAPTAAIFR